MLVNQVITNLLGDTGYPVFYVLKPDGFEAETFITFDATIKSDWFSNDGREADVYYVTINIITKNVNVMPTIIQQIRDIVYNNPHCYYFMNRGSSYIKDTREFFSACTFYMYVFK